MDEREYQRRVEASLPALHRVCRAILFNEQDCADAVQEAVFQGWLKRRQLRNAEKFKAWISQIAVNECRNLQRKALKQKKAVEASMEYLRQAPPRPLTDLEIALDALPEKYRLPLVLYYGENYTTKEIAEMLNLPEGRLRERMRTARKKLEGRLTSHADE